MAGEDTGLSRSALQDLIAGGHVLANGQPAAKNRRLKPGDTILVEIPDAAPIEAVAQQIPLDIVYEDPHLLVVNKPKGMVVHPAPGNPDGTLVNALLWHCRGSLSGIGGEIRPGIVHRIDKDTSGLLVVAKDDATHIGLSRQMAEHSVQRTYQTVVYGGFAQDQGFVEGAIGRSRTDRKKMAAYPVGEPHAKYAYTGWRVLERMGPFTLLECRLKTGRTHQIGCIWPPSATRWQGTRSTAPAAALPACTASACTPRRWGSSTPSQGSSCPLTARCPTISSVFWTPQGGGAHETRAEFHPGPLRSGCADAGP